MSRGPRQPLDPATIAQLVDVTMRLAMEVSVLRDRLRSHELLLEAQGLPGPAAVDAFEPSATEQKQRDASTRALIESLTGALSGR